MRAIGFTIVGLAFVLGLSGCGSATDEAEAGGTPSRARTSTRSLLEATGMSPLSTVKSMLELAKAGEWGTYIDEYYGESHKFRPGHDDRDGVAQRLEQAGEQIIAHLEVVSQSKPVISDDGNRAVFALPEGEWALYRDPDGSWKFHL